MTYTFSGEKIGSNKPWVAEVQGKCPTYTLKREFLQGLADYSNKNSVGTRGIMYFWQLQEGKIYEVFKKVSWNETHRKFIRIQEGQPVELSVTDILAIFSGE